MDYEWLILERQESSADWCASCEYLSECRYNADHGVFWVPKCQE